MPTKTTPIASAEVMRKRFNSGDMCVAGKT
jgi:hypothetical protein